MVNRKPRHLKAVPTRQLSAREQAVEQAMTLRGYIRDAYGKWILDAQPAPKTETEPGEDYGTGLVLWLLVFTLGCIWFAVMLVGPWIIEHWQFCVLIVVGAALWRVIYNRT